MLFAWEVNDGTEEIDGVLEFESLNVGSRLTAPFAPGRVPFRFRV